ncbi:hypothetical protein C2845_PM01G47140 [Panicum miliaceum]|uniref:Uncharacterized protein n=1 Tax=Panicum miliaceum TaxID=4540 RepID=A0A3L6TH50_PANMI|nr:hypothetical protein C2845_PM01G47140 [Panicum miliaceum]
MRPPSPSPGRGGGASSSERQTGHVVCAPSQESMHAMWNAWRQTVSRRTASPAANSDRQTTHSACAGVGDRGVVSIHRTVGNVARTAGSSPAGLGGACASCVALAPDAASESAPAAEPEGEEVEEVAQEEDGEEAEEEHKEVEHRQQHRKRLPRRRGPRGGTRPRGGPAGGAMGARVVADGIGDEAARGRGHDSVHVRMGRDDPARLLGRRARAWLMALAGGRLVGRRRCPGRVEP